MSTPIENSNRDHSGIICVKGEKSDGAVETCEVDPTTGAFTLFATTGSASGANFLLAFRVDTETFRAIAAAPANMDFRGAFPVPLPPTPTPSATPSSSVGAEPSATGSPTGTPTGTPTGSPQACAPGQGAGGASAAVAADSIIVLRVGSGTAAVTPGAGVREAFREEIAPATGARLQTWALPVGGGSAPHHGADGPIPIYRAPLTAWGAMDRVLAEAALDQGHAWAPDHNAPGALGVSPYAINSRDGRRVSTNDAYLEPARGRNSLSIMGDALVDRVLFEGTRAVGVRVRRGGVWQEVRGGLIILAAGAAHSPAILMRSGIGPAADLAALGIGLKQDLPVGQRFQDHPMAFLAVALNEAHVPPPGFRVPIRRSPAARAKRSAVGGACAEADGCGRGRGRGDRA
jgi:hypothetical protein